MVKELFPGSLRFLFGSVILSVVLMVLFRSFFFFLYFDAKDGIPVADLAKAFYLGGKFDLRLALLIHLPLLLLSVLRWTNPLYAKFGRFLWFAWLLLSFATLLLFYIVDLGYYAYLEMRLDASVTRFLKNPLISGQMVLESYPVFTGTVAYLFALVVYYLLIRTLFRSIEHSSGTPRLVLRIPVAAFASLLFFIGILGKFSYYPLRWSEAFFSDHDFVSSLSLNPVLFFASTWKNRRVEYDIAAVREHYPEMARYLGVEKPDVDSLDFTRHEGGKEPSTDKPNVVLIFLESFAFYKSGLSGNPLDATPNFDRLAREGVLFERFYTPHGGTARSVFTAVTGLPDVETAITFRRVETSSRNPLVINQHTIINEFSDYQKIYFLGGSASWGQIRGLLARNIDDLTIYEEGSYESPRVDVWGISDLDLFKEACRELEVQQQPFFAVIQTAGNHKPYTIPEDNNGFKSREIPEKQALRYGFRSVAAYNSYRFMDHSIAYFMEQAKKQPFFDNTLFVFIGDHGLVRNAPHMYPAEEKLLFTRYHVPLVFYAPGMLQPAVYDKVASEVDLMPTIAGLTLPEYRNTTLGRDLFNPKFDDERYAFTIRHQYGPEIGLIGRDYVYRRKADGSGRRLHSVWSETPEKNLLRENPEKAESLETLLQAYYETIKYMRFHNPKL